MKKLIQLALLLTVLAARGVSPVGATDVKGGIQVMFRVVQRAGFYELAPVTPLTLGARLIAGDATRDGIQQCEVTADVMGKAPADGAERNVVTAVVSCPGGVKFRVYGVLFAPVNK